MSPAESLQPLRSPGIAAAGAAAAGTVPHAVGPGLLAFAPLAADHSLAALALWSAALPGLLLTLVVPRAGVVYAPTTVVALLFAAVLATARTGWHLLAALAVVGLAWALRWRWPRMPGLLSAVVLVALAVAVAGVWGGGLGDVFAPAVQPSQFAGPLWPDLTGVPWMALAQQHGSDLVVLALLMALVNSLEILVFNQELELDHGLRGNANLTLRRESPLGVLCGLAGMIPASTSASRSRIVLAQAGPSRDAPRWHAGIMLGVAVTGAWWLHWVPMACLAGGLVLAGLMQVPGL